MWKIITLIFGTPTLIFSLYKFYVSYTSRKAKAKKYLDACFKSVYIFIDYMQNLSVLNRGEYVKLYHDAKSRFEKIRPYSRIIKDGYNLVRDALSACDLQFQHISNLANKRPKYYKKDVSSHERSFRLCMELSKQSECMDKVNEDVGHITQMILKDVRGGESYNDILQYKILVEEKLGILNYDYKTKNVMMTNYKKSLHEK